MSAKHDKRKMSTEEKYDQWMRLLLLEPVAGQTDIMDAMAIKFSDHELESGAFHKEPEPRKERTNDRRTKVPSRSIPDSTAR